MLNVVKPWLLFFLIGKLLSRAKALAPVRANAEQQSTRPGQSSSVTIHRVRRIGRTIIMEVPAKVDITVVDILATASMAVALTVAMAAIIKGYTLCRLTRHTNNNLKQP
jgi:hypothetical protein